jgi:hypothetical protein
MKALLIDPYQKKIHALDIANELSAWYKLLDCHCVDRAEIARLGSRAIDIWVDDNGLQYEPVPPLFKVSGYPNPLAGYGLVLGANLNTGESLDCPVSKEHFAPKIRFEQWEKRLDPADYFEQLTRVPSWEIV